MLERSTIVRNIWVSIGLVLIVVAIFSAYYISFDPVIGKDITDKFTMMEEYLKDENWDKLIKTSKDLKKTWMSKKYYIMLNFAEAEIKVFENHLSYIVGGATAKELDETKSNILAAKNLWGDMKRMVPEP